ncbi:MAG: S-methyl-5-thioribose-1-phosphate isomerase [Firmicutes bacterium]|nr:S-methyl-5-thioribose-1-phosphate isomerase [Bacillota bacterium]
MKSISPIIWNGLSLELLDQRLLPEVERYVHCHTFDDVKKCIEKMVVRGAPAIGVTAVFALLLTARKYLQSFAGPTEKHKFFFSRFQSHLETHGAILKKTRPTAVNLAWGVERILNKSRNLKKASPLEIIEGLEEEAKIIFDEDIEINQKIGEQGAKLIGDHYTILTHCNAGALATAGYGTALGVIRSAFRQGKKIMVYVDETRPFLQGSRLTAWELQKEGIPFSLIVDSAAGYYISKKDVDCIIVGADRIAANGDVANKIGTYSLAVLAKENDVPFYVAAPLSTVDMSIDSGKKITIEERDAEEITKFRELTLAPVGINAKNPAFDITPAKLITALITECGIIKLPDQNKMIDLYNKRGEHS